MAHDDERTRIETTQKVLLEVAEERHRQVGEKGYSLGHDDEHTGGEIALAAMCYACPPGLELRRPPRPGTIGGAPRQWPWMWDTWDPKPDNRRRELVKAMGLLCAEVERLDRAAAS